MTTALSNEQIVEIEKIVEITVDKIVETEKIVAIKVPVIVEKILQQSDPRCSAPFEQTIL